MDTETTFNSQHNLSLPPTVVMSRTVVGGLHLWREVTDSRGKGFSYNDSTLFMSDALFGAVMTGGLHGIAASHRAVWDCTDVG